MTLQACDRVIVTENKINFLTLPQSPNMPAIFGRIAHGPPSKDVRGRSERASISRLISHLPARKSHLNLQLLSRSRCPIRGRHA
jgi:hypothetical protein